jgi:hypothetical protein
MRLATTLAAVIFTVIAGSAAAQTPTVSGPVTKRPNLPTPKLLQDTIIISKFDLSQGAAGGSFNIKASFLGLAPLAYRVSVFDDFRDQPTYLLWPSSNAPIFRTSQSSGTCGQGAIKIAAFLQVRAKKQNGQNVHSAAVRDTVCLFFG